MADIFGTIKSAADCFISSMKNFAGIEITDIISRSFRLRELSMESVLLKLALAVLLGGLIGLERERKHKAAGFRTYMLVCLGATLTIMLGLYEFHMVSVVWSAQCAITGCKTDVARIGAQVVNGIGFLGAGTILVTGTREVTGLTTAAGLWSCACMGLALGAGFYECVLFAFIFIFFAIIFLPKIEAFVVERSKNMDIYVEFRSLKAVNTVTSCLREHKIQIFDIDIDMGGKSEFKNPNAIFSIQLDKKVTHTQIIQYLTQLDELSMIKEL